MSHPCCNVLFLLASKKQVFLVRESGKDICFKHCTYFVCFFNAQFQDPANDAAFICFCAGIYMQKNNTHLMFLASLDGSIPFADKISSSSACRSLVMDIDLPQWSLHPNNKWSPDLVRQRSIRCFAATAWDWDLHYATDTKSYLLRLKLNFMLLTIRTFRSSKCQAWRALNCTFTFIMLLIRFQVCLVSF